MIGDNRGLSIAPLRHCTPSGSLIEDICSSSGQTVIFRLKPRAFVLEHLKCAGLDTRKLRQEKQNAWWAKALAALSDVAAGKDEALRTERNLLPYERKLDDLKDLYLENTATLDPCALDLPAFGLVHLELPGSEGRLPAAARRAARRNAAPALQAGLAFLSRVCGGLYIAGHSPTTFGFSLDTEQKSTQMVLLAVPARIGDSLI